MPLNWDAVSRQIRDQVLSRQMLGQTCNNGINVNLLASPAASDGPFEWKRLMRQRGFAMGSDAIRNMDANPTRQDQCAGGERQRIRSDTRKALLLIIGSGRSVCNWTAMPTR